MTIPIPTHTSHLYQYMFSLKQLVQLYQRCVSTHYNCISSALLVRARPSHKAETFLYNEHLSHNKHEYSTLIV